MSELGKQENTQITLDKLFEPFVFKLWVTTEQAMDETEIEIGNIQLNGNFYLGTFELGILIFFDI